MRGQVAFEAMNNLRDDLILEAAELLGFLGTAPAPPKPAREKRENLLSRFASSGWGVACISLAVAFSVLAGIIWAGRNPPTVGPAGIDTPEQTETDAYTGESQDEVTIQHGDTVIYPRRFFLWSTDGDTTVDGLGFAGSINVNHDGIPVLPKVYYAKDGSISPCTLTLEKGHEFRQVRVYDENMKRAIGYTYDGEFHYEAFLQGLPTGTYYVSLEISVTSGLWSKSTSSSEYAFELVVTDTAADTETEPYIGAEQTDLWIKSSGETVYPREFFLWRETADGVGIGFLKTVQSGVKPSLPIAVYSLDPYDDTAEIFLPEGYEVKSITLYDGSMTDITDEKMNLLFLPDLCGYLSALLPGDYYLCLYVERPAADAANGGETVGADYAVKLRIRNTPNDILPGHEANDCQRTWVALREALRSEGDPYQSMKSHSGLSLPSYEAGIVKHYESRTGDYTVMVGVDVLGNIVMAFDHYRALTILRLTTDGSMRISVESAGNYHCVETVTPPARVDHNFRFTVKNEWYSSTASYDAPLSYLLTGMAYLDELMAELDGDFSLEALGYVYAKKSG